MKNIRFLRVVMLLISLFLCASYGYATTEQKNEKLEEPQKIIRIVVEQSYSDKTYSPVEGINLPFESIAQKLLEYADLKVAHPESENYNLTLKIQAKGEALGTEYSMFMLFGKGTYYYTGASLEGEISLELSGIPIQEKSFFGKISPPSRIDRSQMSSLPTSAPLKDTLWQPNSFGPVIIKLIEEISSPKFLINATKDEDSNVREFSNRFLYGLGKEAVDPLISFLKEEDSFILLKVITALGNIKDSRAIEPLIGVLKDKDSAVRESAVVALKKFGEIAVEPLISALQAKDLEVRRNVIKILGQIKDPRAVEPLIVALKDEDSKVRENIVKAIKEIGKAAVDILVKTLQSEDFDIRVLAAWALGQIGDSRAIDPLIAALQDKEFFVQAKAAEALGEIQDSRAIEPLIEIMKSENILVKKHAADALKKITEQSFGMDYKAWSKWWKEHKE